MSVLLATLAVSAATALALVVDADATAAALLLVLTVQIVSLDGLRAGLSAAVLGAAAFSYFFIEPRGDFVLLGTRDEVIALGVFVAVAALAALLLDRAQRADRAALDAGTRAEVAAAEAEASLRRATLFASIGHDLRTPLAGIRAGIEALAGPSAARPEAAEELRCAVVQETRRMERVLERVLQVARLDGGAIDLDREPVDVVGLAQDCVARLGAAGRCTIDVRPPDQIVVGDPILLGQALGNLIDNALTHGGDDPVSITGRPATGGFLLAVRDRGPGVDEHLRVAIEEPMGAVLPARDHRGAGLGIRIARTVVEAHGGRIRCGPAPGGGTVVELEVPAG